MSISIVANTSANYAQTGMRTRNDALTVSTQKLSSGLRVFSAKEDAAAIAVGTSLKIENAALKTAALNASAGVSALQIADGAMGQISDLVTRMLTLADQSSSGQLDDPTRQLVNSEFSSLMSEVDRISKSLQFNGVNLLAGSKTFTTTDGSTMNLQGIGAVRYDQTLVTGDRMFRYAYDPTTEVMTLSRIDGASTQSQSVDLTALLDGVAGIGQNMSGSEQLNVGFSQLGVSFTLDSSFVRGNAISPGGSVAAGPDITVATPTFSATATNMSMETITGLEAVAGYNATTGGISVPLNTNGTTVTLGGIAGLSYKVNAGAVGASGAASNDIVGAGNTVQVYVDLPGGGNQLLGSFITGAVATTGSTAGSLMLNFGQGLLGATFVDDNGPTRLTYQIGAGVVVGQDTLNVDVPATTLSALGLDTLNVNSQPNADTAIVALKAALTTLGQGRATVGAQQLRLEEVGQNLSTLQENNETARSALLDVDVAKEISDFSSNQAMLEAASAMLARANQMPSMLVDLLKNS